MVFQRFVRYYVKKIEKQGKFATKKWRQIWQNGGKSKNLKKFSIFQKTADFLYFFKGKTILDNVFLFYSIKKYLITNNLITLIN